MVFFALKPKGFVLESSKTYYFLQLKILRKWINVRANSFFKTSRVLRWERLHYYYGNLSKPVFWKLLDHSYVQSSFSTICASNWQQHANSFIKTWEKHHDMKINEDTWKNISCTKTWACTSKNIVPKYATFHFFLHFT